MIDKEQIKAIIKQYADKGERLLEEAYENGEHTSTTGYWDGYGDCANLLLRELDDMQEEPVSEDLDSFAIKYAQDKPYPVTVCQAVKVGANWQKEQDQSTIELAEDHAMLAGMEKMKEHLMAKAVDATIAIPYQNGYGGYTQLVDSKEGLPFGEKLKVLVIKKEIEL